VAPHEEVPHKRATIRGNWIFGRTHW